MDGHWTKRMVTTDMHGAGLCNTIINVVSKYESFCVLKSGSSEATAGKNQLPASSYF